MAIKKYQPERTDLLINTDWGVPSAGLSPEEAATRGLVLFHGRWVTPEELAELKGQSSAYGSLRVVAWLMLLAPVLIWLQILLVALAPMLEFEQQGLAVFAAYLSIFSLAAGIGVYQFKLWGRILGTVVLILGIPTIIGALCLYYLNRRKARVIFKRQPAVSPAGSVDVTGLADLLGVSGRRVRWELLLVFGGAFLLAGLARDVLAPTVLHETFPEEHLSFSFFHFRSVWWWLYGVVWVVAWTASAGIALRLVRHEWVAIGVASVLYIVVTRPALILALAQDMAGQERAIPWQVFLSPWALLFSVVYCVVGLGLLALAIRWIASLPGALFAGLVGGSVVQWFLGLAQSVVRNSLAPAEEAASLSLMWELMQSVAPLMEAVLLALLYWGGLRLAAPGLRLTSARALPGGAPAV